MYGKGLGLANTATGISLLPATGESKTLFIVAVGMIATGAAILVAAAIANRISRTASN